MQQEHRAVTLARKSSDLGVLFAGLGVIAGILVIVFFIGLIVVIAGGEALLGAAQESATGDRTIDYLVNSFSYFVIAGVLLIIILVTIRMMRQQLLGNALQVEYSDYAWLRDWSNRVAADLQMPRVEIFVTQDPVMNAYALGFMTPYNIVLHSGTIRYMTKEELKAIVVHEMAHVKYHHTQWNAYLSALMALPIVGGISTWILGFWSRRAELTADRLALCYLGKPDLVKEALIKVHVGPDVAKSFNQTARDWQVYTSRNAFNRFTQTFSSHPFLVRRLQQIDTHTYLLDHMNPPQAHTAPTGQSSRT